MNIRIDPYELDKIKERTISELKAEKDEPSLIADKIMKKVFYGTGHPYAESETDSSVENIS